MATPGGHVITVSYDQQAIHAVSTSLRRLVLGWDGYRASIAAQLGVGATEVVALGHLYQEGPLTPRDLGQRLGLTSGSVTALLDRLSKSGFVTRAQHPDDRRSLLATATPAGRHAMQWFYEELDAIVGKALTQFPEVPIEALTAMVTSVGDSLISHVGEATPAQRG